MRKFKIIADFDEEEQFLNHMAKKGWRLETYNSLGVYTFKQIQPQDLNYRIDYRAFHNQGEFEAYCTLFQDAGWEHVYGTKRSGAQYFLPIQDRVQTEDIFSDEESKAGRYKRFSNQCFASLTLMIMWFIVFQPHGWSFFDVRSWYFTDGLWNMPSSLLWKAVLFETPFVIVRIVPFVFLLYLAVLYGYWALKAKEHYKNMKKLV